MSDKTEVVTNGTSEKGATDDASVTKAEVKGATGDAKNPESLKKTSSNNVKAGGDKAKKNPLKEKPQPKEPTEEERLAALGVDINKKHPLENEWTFFYDRRQTKGGRRPKKEKNQWENNLKKVGDFSTVEDFWCFYNNLLKPIQLEPNSNYHLFKRGVKPMWEDPANKNGGKWIISLKGSRDKLNQYWESVILCLIGEMLEPSDSSDEVCGAVMSRRKNGDRIAIWNRRKDSKEVIMALGRAIKEVLQLPNNTRIKLSYQVHEDSLKSGASYTNPARYEL